MNDYAAIDAVLMPWAQARGLHVYTGHARNQVRSVTLYVWVGTRHESTGHIWLDAPNELGLVGVYAAHEDFRLGETVLPERLEATLDAMADRLLKQRLHGPHPDQMSISPRR